MAESFKFHLFVSYTRTPDGALARELERFLEAFDRTPLRPDLTAKLTPLHVCVDGSDFSLPPLADASDAAQEDVLSVVRRHLAMSRELLVLCSARAAASLWVTDEIRWFLEHRGPHAIRFAFTEGEQPWMEEQTYFSAPFLEHALHKGIAYDLRGYDARRAHGWKQVPEFRREMVRLAADLMGLSAGDLYPTWLEAELERTRLESLTLASTARFETLGGDPSRALLIAQRAHELHPGDATEIALRDAYKVAVLQHYNRREASRLSGSGPAYLASRWKQGELFTRTSADGKYRLLVTERGKDGPHPPGDVYLVSNETLRTIKLVPPERHSGRVEDVAFDRASRRVLVTRQFNLAVYAIDGRYLGEYEFSRHTKSPVHLVDGLFADKYILGAETKGGVWLIELSGKPESTLKVLGEFHGDVTLFTDISRSGRRAVLVFESGRAALLTLGEDGKPKLTDLAKSGALFAGFAAGSDDLAITAGQDGSIVLWDLEGEPIREAARMKPLPSPLDWVSLDDDGQRLAAVGANHKLYIVDRASGELLNTLDYSEALDWAALRSIPATPRVEKPWSTVTFGPAVPFPPPDLLVSGLQRIDGETWMFAEDRSESEYFPDHAVYRLEGTEAKLFPGVNAARAEKHGQLLFMQGYGAYRRSHDSFRSILERPVKVNCLHMQDGIAWVGTQAGVYRHDGESSRLVTPDNLNVLRIEELGGRLWVLPDTGAYVIEDERLVRVADPFLRVIGIREAGDATWLLPKSEGDDPVYRVHGYFATPLPSSRSKVSRVIDADGAAWLAETDRVHRVAGADVRTVDGLAADVDGIVQVGRTLWLTTYSRHIMVGRLQSYRVDAHTLVPEALDVKASIVRAAGRAWLQYTKDERVVLAEPREDGLRDLDLGAGALTTIAERDGEPWFLTTAGAFRHSAAGIVAADVPALPYHALVDVKDGYWLLAHKAAVRVGSAGVTVMQTGEHTPRAIRRTADRTWIITSEGFKKAGPAYRVARTRATAVTPPEGGVADVVDLDGQAWLLTSKDGRAGLLRKA